MRSVNSALKRSQPRGRVAQFCKRALFQHSYTPTSCVTGIEDEDDDEDENEAPHEHLQPATRVQF
jgi:hypothetical protein